MVLGGVLQQTHRFMFVVVHHTLHHTTPTCSLFSRTLLEKSEQGPPQETMSRGTGWCTTTSTPVHVCFDPTHSTTQHQPVRSSLEHCSRRANKAPHRRRCPVVLGGVLQQTHRVMFVLTPHTPPHNTNHSPFSRTLLEKGECNSQFVGKSSVDRSVAHQPAVKPA